MTDKHLANEHLTQCSIRTAMTLLFGQKPVGRLVNIVSTKCLSAKNFSAKGLGANLQK
jgi:hypothetical protein